MSLHGSVGLHEWSTSNIILCQNKNCSEKQKISKRKHLIKEGKQKNPGQEKTCSNEKPESFIVILKRVTACSI